MKQQQLPIDAVMPQLLESLRSGVNAVLVAEPGAGKTTRVPLALLDQPWLSGKKIIMLEPRRLAARSAAQFMAQSLGEQVGGTVGYRVRLDSRVSPRTRIEVVRIRRLSRSEPSCLTSFMNVICMAILALRFACSRNRCSVKICGWSSCPQRLLRVRLPSCLAVRPSFAAKDGYSPSRRIMRQRG